MSHPFAMGLAIFCVCLTAAAQVMLRAGMSSAALQQAMAQGLFSLDLYRQALASPLIWGGMACFGASVALWLPVLAKLEVSVAYPLTSLGLVLTACAGVLLLGESISTQKVLGILLIVAGVLVLSLKH
ncbi:DMT family transporter [Propionivibrio dicarboxylicus]|uniref:EamA-like transporter family protein n=1 Tax=Propionivibrio dicarboxylicus TaxID=83767 RepID=A0A1G8BMN6_9RHOO|nr:SMR family transporter [Propionivibrio dicarboxylicus]SDH34479.1 EamA-like transporter family protein [Propionivibrio dicarboxylicus]